MPQEKTAVESTDISYRGRALVVDDEVPNCKLLSAMLKRLGFDVEIAHDGLSALEIYNNALFDIIFMDVMMPGMNGYQTTREIRNSGGDFFIPIIFLTALRNDEALAECIDAGGDDFMSKPFSFTLLEARIRSMERIRDMHRALSEQNDQISTLLKRSEHDQLLAERIFNRLVAEHNTPINAITTLQRPATTFCGDLVLSTCLPSGNIRVLVADFTGHGMAAAIGAMPVAALFRDLSHRGVCDAVLLSHLNCRLHKLLPAELFMAACLVTINTRKNTFWLWNGGMPSAWLLDNGVITDFDSVNLPLGILPEIDAQPVQYNFESGDRLLIRSDGLHEANDLNRQMLGEAAITDLLSRLKSHSSPVSAIGDLLEKHLDGNRHDDDITLVDIDLSNLSVPRDCAIFDSLSSQKWQWRTTLIGRQLATVPNFGQLLRTLDIDGRLEAHLPAVETIITELYNNALDHGLLELNSRGKDKPDGFAEYYSERKALLAEAENLTGSITLEIDCEYTDKEGLLTVRIQDSGSGFSPQDWAIPLEPKHCWGRGIAIVRELADTVHYSACGTEVEATCRF